VQKTTREVEASDFSSARFDHSTQIDNRWFPARPGMRYTYLGSTIEDGVREEHRVVFVVTSLTKVIDGVETVVGWDRDYADGALVEAEILFSAQDNGGNVWHLGEYPEEYEEGKLVKTPGWIAGVEGARAGVFMRADPRLGSRDHSQGYAPPPINWADRARVYKVGQTTCVPAGCYNDVLVMEEFQNDKPEAFQLKYYVEGIGSVRVGWRGPKEDSREVLVLQSVERLDAAALAEADNAAREMERHAYKLLPAVFGDTEPAR
jgi:hypothetical protein